MSQCMRNVRRDKKVAVVERWPLVEVRLYTFTSLLMDTLLKPTAIVVTCLSFSFWLTFSKRHGHIERNVRLIESQIKGRAMKGRDQI